MDADRRSAVLTGVFFIVGTVVGVIGLGVVLEPLNSATDYQPLRKTGVYLNVNKDSGSGGGSPQDLVFLKELIETDKVRTVIDRRYPLEKIVEAHTYVEKGHKRGNVVVTVS